MLLRNNIFHKIYKYIRWILIPFVPLYQLVFYIIKLKSRPKKLEIPVICVGNITTGGTGKTPAVILLAELLKDEGCCPGIVSRGYKGSKSKEGALVSDGQRIMLTPEEAGDEPYLMAMRLQDIPIAIGKDRLKAIRHLREQFDINIIIMDDGFQNFSFYKDFSIITIDATRPFGNGFILPAGDLREPESGLKRANLLLVNKSDLVSNEKLLDLRVKIQRKAPHLAALDCAYLSDSIYSVDDMAHVEPVSVLTGRRILLITAIGNPDAFCETVKRFKPLEIKLLSYPDHYWFDYKDVQTFLNESEDYDYVLMTEKDYVRLKKYSISSKFYFLKITMNVGNEDFLKQHLVELIGR